MNVKDKIDELREYVKKKFDEADLKFCGFKWYFDEHISHVERIAQKLALKYGADLTVVRLAALFHDIGLIGKGRQGHEERSAKIAEKILTEKGFNKRTIKRVKSCILQNSDEIEAKVLSTADALSHFRASFLFVKAKMFQSYKDFKKWVIEKLEQDLKRIKFQDEYKCAKKKLELIKSILSENP